MPTVKAGERTGAGGVDDHTDSDTVTLDVLRDLTKSIISTNHLVTTLPDVTIGELLTYEITIVVPPSSSDTYILTDTLDAGLAFVDCADITAEPGLSSSTIAFNTAGNCAHGAAGNPAISNQGGTIVFDLGTVTNVSAIDHLEITIQYTVVVLNLVGSFDGNGVTYANDVSLTFGGHQLTATTPGVTIIESEFSLSKTVNRNFAAPGDTITFSLDVAHTANSHTAGYDLLITDVIPAEFDIPGGGLVVSDVSGQAFDRYNYDVPTRTLTIEWDEMLSGNSSVVSFDLVIGAAAPSGDLVTNTAVLQWTSLPGVPTAASGQPAGVQSEYHLDSTERTGSGVAPNDYTTNNSAGVTIYDPFYSKSITYSSAVHTAIPAHAVGEVATFSLSVTLPKGTAPTLQIVDDIPAGLDYVPGSAELITTNGQSAACPLTNDFNGSFTASDPVITATGGSGVDVTFDFSTITVVDDGDATNNTFLICFEALVVNESGVDNGDVLTNSADFTIRGVTDTQTVDVQVVEPILDVTKQVSDDTPGAGEIVTFTLDLTHDALASSAADAFEVGLTDVLPAELILDLASVAYTVGGASVPTGITNTSSGNTVSFTIDEFPLTGTMQITFDAQVDILAVGSSFDNTASLTWTSLPGIDTGERTGTGGVNDHTDIDTVTLNVLRDLTKAIISTNHAVTTLPSVTIGELLTYEITIVVPPSSSEPYILTDTLDEGLAFVDCADILAEADLTSTTIAFNTSGNCAHGTAGNPAISNQGGMIVFDLGTVTNASAIDHRTITIQYTVVVLNLVGSFDGNGVTYANDVTLIFGGHQLNTTTPGVSIVEAQYSLEKTVNKKSAAPGDTVTFFLEVAHTTNSHTTGYDLQIIDVLPKQFNVPDAGLVVFTENGQPFDRYNYNDVTRTLTIEWDELPLGSRSMVGFKLEVGKGVRSGQSLTNEANLVWSSLPGIPAGAAGQPAGVQSPYHPSSTERDYDPASPANLSYTANSAINLSVPELPDTGFAPGQVTPIMPQPADLVYDSSDDMRLVIPALDLDLTIVGVPLSPDGWNLTWLGSQAGYLEGTAYPTLPGNTGITAHVYSADGLPGPFVDLETLDLGPGGVHLCPWTEIYLPGPVR